MPLQAVVVIMLGDICVYWFHRACHALPLLWRFHAVHHSAEHLDWLAAHREHPVDGLLTQLAVNAPALILGFSLGQVAWLIALRGMWAIFVHSNVRLPLGPLRILLGAPELHHWHHLRAERAQNFANLAPWTDLLFGTYHNPSGPETWPLGTDHPLPRSYLGMLARPLWPAASTRDAPAE
jgi:sterol desaturase/sphingolipid hydroxylase (fatty acid hydroxylase superfamily)